MAWTNRTTTPAILALIVAFHSLVAAFRWPGVSSSVRNGGATPSNIIRPAAALGPLMGNKDGDVPLILHPMLRVRNFKSMRALFAAPSSSGSKPSKGPVMLKCDGLSKTYREKPQFEEVAFNLCAGDRMGLIGVNGAGKSTLLRCLAGVERPDEGTVERSKSSNVIFVEQDPYWGDCLVTDALFDSDAPADKAVRSFFQAQYGVPVDQKEQALIKATEAMTLTDAWERQFEGITIANHLSIPEEMLSRRVSTLSGGEKKRIALSAALLKHPDALLLDEPTNHLDIKALDWLASYLRGDNVYSNPNLALLLVTHDRHFLDLVCNEIIELDKGTVHFYPGSYSKFIEMRKDRVAAKTAEIERAKTELKKEKEWMGRQPQGRQAKSKARMENFYELEKLAKQKITDGAKLELIAAGDNRRLGGVVVNLENVSYSLPGDSKRLMLDQFSYNLNREDRIGIVGPNGVGKSTFLKILTGSLLPDSGTVEIGETVTFGFYNQMGIILTDKEKEMTVIKFIQESFDKGSGHAETSQSAEALAFSETEAMSLMTKFQFPSSRWFEPMGALSGGEKRRLQLLQILAKKPNVLVLDEPSNDLDLSTLQVLEDYLINSFTGTVVCVSHDRMFMDNVPEHLFVFDGNGVVRNFKGKYSDYLDSLNRRI